MSVQAFLTEHWETLLGGSTLLLLVTSIAVAVSRAPVHAKSIGGLGLWGIVVFLVLTAVPLPRPLMPTGHQPVQPAPASPPPIVSIDSTLAPALLPGLPGQELGGADRPPNRDGGATPTSEPVALPMRVAEVGPRDVLATAYLLGAALCALWVLVGLSYLFLVLGRSCAAPSWIQDLVPQARGQARILVTPFRCRPFCVGFWPGSIVLPANLAHPGRREQLRQVLLHELGHLRQGELSSQLALTLLLPFLFFNPLYWWLRRKIRMASELLADDWAAHHSSKTEYARELIALAEDTGHRRTPLGATGILSSPSEFYRRIKMLLEREGILSVRCSRRRNILQRSAAALLVAGVVSLGGVTAQDRVDTATIATMKQQLSELKDQNRSLRALVDKLWAEVVAKPPTVGGPGSPFTTRTVKKGDTLDGLIAENELPETPAGTFKKLNPGLDPLRLPVGREIRLLTEPETEVAGATDSPPNPLASSGGYEVPQGPILDADTLQLMNQAIDLEVELSNGMEEVEELKSLAEKDFVDRGTLNRTQRAMEGTRKKLALIRSVLEAELVSTQQSLEQAKKQREVYSKESAQYQQMSNLVQRLQFRLRALSSAF